MPLLDLLHASGRDLGGFGVQRALPRARRRSVGPFVFWDEMGPSDLPAGKGLDVRPHPHIGLATLTFLFQGAIDHRDSLGSVQRIVPGDVNLMIAGSGIVHSERTPPDLRATGHRLHGIQAWVALPASEEERAPSFHHVPGRDLPVAQVQGVQVRVVVGAAFGHVSPVPVPSPTLFADAHLDADARLTLSPEHPERAVYVVSGRIHVAGVDVEAGGLAVLEPGEPVTVRGVEPSHVVFLGGEPLDAPRHMSWNFVSSRPERVAQARHDWWQAVGSGFSRGPFRMPPGESDPIPLPGPAPEGPPDCTPEHPTS